VEGIQGGLVIKGIGTFNLHNEDNEGAVHHIKIPNSNYIPGLKICLLLPQHLAQETQDKYPLPRGTRIEDNDEALLLIWNQGKHKQTVLHSPLTNTPTFITAPALRTYHAFVALYNAAEAQYYCRESILQIPGQLRLHDEFVAEGNVHSNIQEKALLFLEGVTSNNVTVKVCNLSSAKESNKTATQTTRMGPLTFNHNPQLKEDEHIYLSADDDQAELMQWHYHLGHLSFSKLKQLALNGKSLDALPRSSLPPVQDAFLAP
jgi:hypothetical protein